MTPPLDGEEAPRLREGERGMVLSCRSGECSGLMPEPPIPDALDAPRLEELLHAAERGEGRIDSPNS